MRAGSAVVIADNTIRFDGSSVGVLLVHGLGGTPIEMKLIGKRISETGATVVCCQLDGHCGSAEDLLKTGWHDWYASAERALADLEKRCSTVIVGGLSMGAVLAARLAALNPERVQGTILLAPTLWYDGWSMPWYKFLFRPLRHTPIVNFWSFVEEDPFGIKDERTRAVVMLSLHGSDSSKAGLLATPGKSISELVDLVDDTKKLLPKVKQPAFLVHSREDDLASLSNSFYLQKNLGGLVYSLTLNDSYHMVTVDKQRKLVMDRAAQFVMEIAASVEKTAKRTAERLRVV